MRRALSGLGIAVLFLLLAEVAARLAFGAPVARLVVRMPDGSEAFLVRDGEFARTTYQDRFAEPPIRVEPPDDTPRVIWLGGSSIRGGGGKTPASLEAASLAGDALGVETVNLAAPGLDTIHLLALVPEALSLHPDAVVFYEGHNDLGNAVFHNRYGDLRSVYVARGRALLGRSRLFQALESTVRSREVFAVPVPGSEGSYSMTEERRNEVHRHFEDRLRRIVRAFRQAGVPVVVATPASNPVAPALEWSCPSALGRIGYGTDRTRERQLGAIDRDVLARERMAEPECRDLQWIEARIEADTGDPARGLESLDRLRDIDPWPLRADRRTVETVRRVASEEQAWVADSNRAFRVAGGGVEPPLWFVDPVHFSGKGNEALAAVVAPILASALGLSAPDLSLPEAPPTRFMDCWSASCSH